MNNWWKVILFLSILLLSVHSVHSEDFRDTWLTRTDYIDVEGPIAESALLFITGHIGMDIVQTGDDGSDTLMMGQSSKLQALMKKLSYSGPRRIYIKPGEYRLKTKVDMWSEGKQSLDRLVSKDFHLLSQKFEASIYYILEADSSLGDKWAKPRIRMLDQQETKLIDDNWQKMRRDINDTDIKCGKNAQKLERLTFTENRLSCPRLVPGQNSLSHVSNYALITIDLNGMTVNQIVVPRSVRLKWYSSYDWTSDGREVICILNRSTDKDNPRYAIHRYGQGSEPQVLVDKEGWDLKWARPELSPDGKYLYFNYREQNKDFIARMNMADGTVESLFPGTHPSLSPDNTRLCFIRNGCLLIKNIVENSVEIALTNSDYSCSEPDFSPDSRWIVFSNYKVKKGTNLCFLSADGGRVLELTHGKARSKEPHWGHDGQVYFITGWSHGSSDDEEIWRLTPMLK